MIRINCIVILSVFLLISCNHTDKRHDTKSSDTNPSLKKDNINLYTPTYFDYKNTRIANGYRDTSFAIFSNDTIEDRFTLNVPSGLVTDTKTTIHITTKQGEVIYEHTFPTSDLINGYATEEIKTDSEMEKYILSQAKSILKDGLYDPEKLSQESFLNQAIKEDFNDYEVFENIKKTNKLMFHYCLNEESNYYLGYSDKKKKVVEIIYCC